MLLYAFLAGVVVGAILWSKVAGWWRKSAFKKATDVVGSAARGPSKVAKNLTQRWNGLFGKLFGNKNDKEKP